MADMSIACGSEDHKFIVHFATWMVFFYVFVVPGCIGAMLWNNREAIANRDTRSGGKELETLS